MRLSSMSRPMAVAGPGAVAGIAPQQVLEDLSGQIDVLEAARAELAAIDRASGLPVFATRRFSG